jgi:hypothetical protein
MQTWFDEYVKQISSPWPHKDFSDKWKKFDMFTLWRISSGKYKEFERFNELNIKILSRRWNTTIQDLPEDLDGPRVITQIDKETWKKIPHPKILGPKKDCVQSKKHRSITSNQNLVT